MRREPREYQFKQTVTMNPGFNAAELKIARTYSQFIIVAVTDAGSAALMYERTETGICKEIVNTEAVIGKNGLGKTKEGDGKTPAGLFTLTTAFGIKDNPGTALVYKKLEDSDYWVDDPASKYYNRFVSMREVEKDWNTAEHLIDEKTAYRYAIAVDYNTECRKEAGSAIFLHCFSGGATQGCIAVPEENMLAILKNIKKDCAILIEDAFKISAFQG